MKSFPALIFATCILFTFSCRSKQSNDEQGRRSSGTSSPNNSKNISQQEISGEKNDFNYADFKDLKNNKRYDRFYAGELVLPTGQVVCTDPMYRELGLPQSWTVKPGKYPVYLYIGLDDNFGGRIAYAELVIKDEVPAEWQYSLIPENLLADSFEILMNGVYPVENGLSSFSDFSTYKIYDQEIDSFNAANKNGNYYLEILEPLFKKNKEEDWVDYKPKKANANIIMFSAGMGDGLYPRYVGYDKNKTVVKMITDFIQLDEGKDVD